MLARCVHITFHSGDESESSSDDERVESCGRDQALKNARFILSCPHKETECQISLGAAAAAAQDHHHDLEFDHKLLF